MIKFYRSGDIENKIKHMVGALGLKHIDTNRVVCMRSLGSASKYTIARCYALPKVWQKALNIDAHYIIEIISEKYDKLDETEKEKTLIHELMHIPAAFGGGFRHHNPYVTKCTVEKMFEKYKKLETKKFEGPEPQ